MAFYDKFPYTNFQELNLDWLTQEVSKVRDNRDASDASAAAALASEQAAKASETAAAASQKEAAASQEAAEESAESIRTLGNQVIENTQRIDTILVEGTPTQGNAELIDIRSGGDSVTYSTAGDAVRGQFYDINNALSTNIFNVNNWENGAFSATNGQPVASTERIRSKTYLPVSIKRAYSTNAAIRFLLYGYNAETGAYIGGWNGNGFTSDDVMPFAELDMTAIFKNYPSYKFKLAIRLSGGSIQISNASGIYFSNAILENMKDTDPNGLVLSPAGNIAKASYWEIGAISTATGANVSNTQRARSAGYLPANTGTLRVPSTRGFFILAYTASGSYVGAWRGIDNAYVLDGSELGYDSYPISELMARNPSYQFRVSIYPRNGVAITESEFSTFMISNAVNNPTYEKMRIMQWNAGRFNFGNDGGLSEDVEMYIHRIRDYIAAEQPDVITMQEFTKLIDKNKLYPTDATLFTPVFLNESYEEHLLTVKSQKMQTSSAFSYLHTTGDNPAYCIYANTSIGGHQAMMVSAVLNTTAPEGIDHLQQQIRALTKLTDQVIGNTPFAVIGMDVNVKDLEEVEAIKTFMESRGYQSANWNHFGNIATLQPGTGMYECIDNVFVKGAAKITGCKVDLEPRYLPSDHSPLMVDIYWRAD